MLARWDLKTVESGVDIAYQNLWTEEVLACGETDMNASELLDWMLNEGGGHREVVFVDGVYALHLMAPLYENLELVRAEIEVKLVVSSDGGLA